MVTDFARKLKQLLKKLAKVGSFPGTGTPEPAGGAPHDIFSIFSELKNDIKLVGCDVLELAPQYDPAGISAVLAAKTLRELLLLF